MHDKLDIIQEEVEAKIDVPEDNFREYGQLFDQVQGH